MVKVFDRFFAFSDKSSTQSRNLIFYSAIYLVLTSFDQYPNCRENEKEGSNGLHWSNSKYKGQPLWNQPPFNLRYPTKYAQQFYDPGPSTLYA